MSKRLKITIAISGILIVALALLSFTYAYITTIMTKNPNSKSVTVSTKDSTIVYTNYDVTSDSSEIAPGTNTYMKFTVRNTGNQTSSYKIYLMDVYNDFSRTSDITYTLYRKSGNNTMDVEDISNCSSTGCTQLTTGTFPTADTLIRSGDSLTSGSSYTYILKIKYNTSTSDQTGDVGHKFSGRIQIFGSESTIDSVSPFNEGTLAEKIYRNAKNVTSTTATGTMYRPVPLTTPAQEVCSSTEKTLSIAQDDYGASYYYRGNTIDNYLEFNNMCWRIVRIEGDGSIKITLAKEGKCNTITSSDTKSALINNAEKVIYGYNTSVENGNNVYSYNYQGYNGGLYTKINEWYDKNIKIKQNYLKYDTWFIGNKTKIDVNINGDNSFKYMSGKRLIYGTDRYATLKYFSDSNVDSVNSYIGILTADEVVYAGLIGQNANLTDDGATSNSYILKNGLNNYWVFGYSINDLGTEDYPFVTNIYSNDKMCLYDDLIHNTRNCVRPAVTLKTDIMYRSGDGTINNAYTIKEY